MTPPLVLLPPGLAAEIERAMLCDRHRLRRRLHDLERQLARSPASEQANEALSILAEKVRASVERREQRAARRPAPNYPAHLPVVKRKDEIAEALTRHQVIVVCGETGSGKTTQLPKICLEIGRGVDGFIGHTQPRRLAARTLAARISSELESEVGRAVGYKVRFTDRVSEDTYVKLMTDGILLAETQGDRFLEQYDTIIVDEAHERSLNVDFLLGYLKRLLPKRPDLKVVVTSATIDPQRFADHFGGAPVIEVSGRTFPVEVRYRPRAGSPTPSDEEDADAEEQSVEEAIVAAVREVGTVDRGDILVFLPGEREIRMAADALRKQHLAGTEVLPLFARLSAGEQQRVFSSHSARRIVLATNVAETSLTVPGVRYVIDTGLARMSRYDTRRKVQRLPIERISRASADQRKGRCGRTSAGVCIRLYSEDDFGKRSEFTPPEIVRTNLAAVILQMAALGLGDVEQFPFLEAPSPRAVRDGYATLFELGAIDDENRLTKMGRRLAQLPVDPRIGRMILAGEKERCLAEVLIIASALSVQDPRQRPFDAREKADQAHKRFHDEGSDFVSFLKLWGAYQEQAQSLSKSQLRKWCEDNFVSALRMREWQDVHEQLRRVVKDMGLSLREGRGAGDGGDGLHKAVLAGLLGNVALRVDEKSYAGARNVKMSIFPGSGLAKKRPPCIMAAELVETDRLYARTVAKIEPAWIEPLADHLLGRSYSEPHWEKQRGQVVGYERVSLYGLTIVARRKVDYGRIDAETAREIFLRTALVEGELRTAAPFLRHNRALVESIEALQERTRRRDLLVDEQVIYDFYQRLVPEDVYSAASFERWRKQAEAQSPETLFLQRDDLLVGSEESARGFPESIEVADGLSLPLTYRFEPSHPEDGVTVTVPLGALHQLSFEGFGWLVPGLLAEKMGALLGSLPKTLRKSFVPAPDFVTKCLDALVPSDASLEAAMAAYLERVTGVRIPEGAWRVESIPEHLRMSFRVVGEKGEPVGVSRDLEGLQRQFGEAAQVSFARSAKGGIERDLVTQWDFGDALPERVEARAGRFALPGYPALSEEGDHVALRVFESLESAAHAHRAGLRRLYALRLGDVVKYLRRTLPGVQAMSLQFAMLGTGDDLRDDLIGAAVDRACIGSEPPARTRDEFEKRAEVARGQLGQVANELCERVARVLAAYHAAAKALAAARGAIPSATHASIAEHLGRLVYRGFILETPWDRLPHLTRYLKAIELRVERLRQQPARDRERAAQVDPAFRQYLEVTATPAKGGRSSELERYRWLLEEWRVSVFAQELKTAEPVSAKRLAEQWDRAVRELSRSPRAS